MIDFLPRTDVEFLLVSCCLEETRVDILRQTVDSLVAQAPYIRPIITVFDNASNQPGVTKLLTRNFNNVYVSDRNVGYWSAVDWWIRHITPRNPKYTYIIESDMIHYAFERLWDCAKFMDEWAHVGAVRLHEYSVANKHLYDKGNPRPDSKRNIWQSHHNKVTDQKVRLLGPNDAGIYFANFLTQLPALNRFDAIDYGFKKIRAQRQFTELEFQQFCHRAYQTNAIIDGGIFHCDPGCWGAPTVTGSFTPERELAKIGYVSTRFASITEPDRYNVKRL